MKLLYTTKLWLVRFTLTTALISLVVVTTAWFTPLRDVLHGALLTVAVVAFLPFILALIGLVLLGIVVMICAIGAIFGEAVDPTAGLEGAAAGCELSVAVAPGYYRWLARRRHPFFWGLWAGCLVGAGLLGLLLFCVVIPGESQTALRFAAIQGAIEEYRLVTGVFPAPTEAAHLDVSELEGISEEIRTESLFLDGFGRPVRYSLEVATPTLITIGGLNVSSGRGVRYRLTSLGFDGVESKDDLIFAGPAFRVSGDGHAGILDNVAGKLQGGAAKQYLKQLASKGGKLEPMIDALAETESYRQLTRLLESFNDAGDSKLRRWSTKMDLILTLRDSRGSSTSKDDDKPATTP